MLRKPNTFKYFFIFFPYLVLAFFAVYFGYQRCRPTFIKDGVKYSRSLCGNIKTTEKLPIKKNSKEKKVNAKIYTNSEANYWEIVDISKSPHFPTGLKFFDNDSSVRTVVRWNNYLLGINLEKYIDKSWGTYFASLASRVSEHYTLQSQIKSIHAYNLDTGETFDISLDKPIWGEIWYVTSQVVDSTYYFGVGGAFGPSLGYKLELPPQRTSRITKLTINIGSAIKKFGNIYIGSACYEGCMYSLFNPSFVTAVSLKRMNSASNDRILDRKEEFIGIDSLGRMILNIRNVPKDDKNNRQHYTTEMIAAVPLNNENITNAILKASDMPEKIYQYFMIDGIDKILMLGEFKVYIYNLTQNQFKEIQTSQKLKEYLSVYRSDPGTVSFTKTDKSICFAGPKIAQSAIDLTTETYLETPAGDCKELNYKKTQEEAFKELNLSDNFKLIYTPVTYRTYDIVKEIPESELPKDAEIIK